MGPRNGNGETTRLTQRKSALYYLAGGRMKISSSKERNPNECRVIQPPAGSHITESILCVLND